MDGWCLLVFVLEIILIRPIIGDLQETLDFQNAELPSISELCYEVYDSKDPLACLEPRRNNNIICTKYVGNGNYAIQTPTNETVIFSPDEYENEKCFDIHRGNNVTYVCKQFVDDEDNYGQFLSTPDNFTIWFGDGKCNSSITKEQLEEDGAFIANYRFDYTKKKCYKIFKPSEKINFYTCGSSNTSEICVSQYDNCFIFTHENETMEFGCVDGNVTDNFITVTHNGNISMIPLEELVTGCVGFVTPSGLRILVYCLKCYNDLSKEVGIFQNGDSRPCYYMYDNRNSLSCREPRKPDRIECLKYHMEHRKYGLSTPTNETILFTSILPNTKACFTISKRDKLTEVCVENDPEGEDKSLTTPDNFTIWFFNKNCPKDSESMHTLHLEQEAKYINDYEFKYKEKRCYKFFDTDESISPYTCLNTSIIDYCQEEIDNCSVIFTKHNETVILGCLNETNEVEGEKCIKVIYKEHDYNICLEKLEERCLGFTTPSGLRILVYCVHCYENDFETKEVERPKRKCFDWSRHKETISCKEPSNLTCMEHFGKERYGLTTGTNETILFVPPFYERAEWFNVYKEQVSQTRIYKEDVADGVKLTTPDNFTIWLSNKCNRVKFQNDKKIKFQQTHGVFNVKRNAHRIKY